MKFRRVYAKGALACGLAATAIFTGLMLNASQEKTHKALAWTKGAESYSNIIPFVWIHQRSTPEQIKSQVDSLPPGYKAALSAAMLRKYSAAEVSKQEKILDRKLEAHEISGLHDNPLDGPIWWDNGVAVTQKRFDNFFKKYHELGGQLDFFILDFEEGMSNWHLSNKAETFNEIAKDPRFKDISGELGFSDLEPVYKWRSGDTYLRWNALMKKREGVYVNQAIYDPIKKYYPEVIMSNYNFYCRRKVDFVPCLNGHNVYKYEHGAVVGNRQAPALYCDINQLRHRVLSGKEKYQQTPFNGFRHSLNVLRTATLASDIPVTPWISHKGYSRSQVRKSDLYQELIFHAGLSGVNTFLLWNPNSWKKGQDMSECRDEQQDKLVNDCLLQLDEIVTGDKRQTLIKNIIPWGDDYVLTGMQLDGNSIWRFTPEMKETDKITDFIISENPVKLKVKNGVLSIPSGKILTPKTVLSNQGLWIVAPLSSVPAVSQK